jgi:broad specificity phosphatase PhoE
MQIHLLRHATTDCNRLGKLCGADCKLGLNEVGRRMAARLARQLSQTPYHRVVTSPLARATQTAEPIARALGLQLEYEPDLVEVRLGAWEGRTPQDLAAAEPDSFKAYRDDADLNPPPGGETLSALFVRAYEALTKLTGPGPVLVVSHKTVLRVLLAGLSSQPLRDYRRLYPMPSGSLTAVEIKTGSRSDADSAK